MGPPDQGTTAQGHSDATQKALRVNDVEQKNFKYIPRKLRQASVYPPGSEGPGRNDRRSPYHPFTNHYTANTIHISVAMALRVCGNLTTLFPERGALIGRVAAARKAGFRVVEVSLPYRETSEALAKELHDHQLEALLINSDPGNFEAGEMGCACQPGKEAQFKTSLDKSLMYAKALNVSMIHVMVGSGYRAHRGGSTPPRSRTTCATPPPCSSGRIVGVSNPRTTTPSRLLPQRF
ncbi:putative hydroxypyruvate isomerase [Chionoecetes opilio]|uniref:Putative hydroxypyruvate isomerase n=1 Tax=Chionoecetes opilio TaxID=41210 RepID=A0A8J5BZ14_CHIOP|nr:putative hydroxypyruvate isomerase [Chionoecetes opilio]